MILSAFREDEVGILDPGHNLHPGGAPAVRGHESQSGDGIHQQLCFVCNVRLVCGLNPSYSRIRTTATTPMFLFVVNSRPRINHIWSFFGNQTLPSSILLTSHLSFAYFYQIQNRQ